ncbi:hypothetical protein CLIBASIA_01195 [Candidatus Liberibacter asiaticus str. psy62]|uniref:Uncharacterized protein n=1 Tax=Liberibacter asiaticus (strain psy62) TaxID=537021 RepID=C6XHT4_LIBAP|nr:hypothetical protein CLIBASIA_01195 [Candidatus Liberibacter asiaticus str. psy62]BAP26112.1 hypothetical protein CGUJ_01195 [Candidatus Liberibacter asiaticus str. Ishi-1]
MPLSFCDLRVIFQEAFFICSLFVVIACFVWIISEIVLN